MRCAYNKKDWQLLLGQTCNEDLHLRSRRGNAEVGGILNTALQRGTHIQVLLRSDCVLLHKRIHFSLQQGVSTHCSGELHAPITQSQNARLDHCWTAELQRRKVTSADHFHQHTQVPKFQKMKGPTPSSNPSPCSGMPPI